MKKWRYLIRWFILNFKIMSEQEVREFEENIVKGANIAFQRLVSQKKKENGELVFSRNGHIFRVKAADLEDFA